MKVDLRGTISASLGIRDLEIPVPDAGLPLGKLLEALAISHPRAARYLTEQPASATLRVVHNGSIVDAGTNPIVHEQDSLLLIQAVAGGWIHR